VRPLVALLFPALLGACGQFSDLVDPIHPPKAGPAAGDLMQATDARCVAPAPSAYIVYQAQASGRLLRIEARPGGAVEDLTEHLELLGPGADDFVNASPGGDSLVIGTTRVGCAAEACLAVATRDACAAQAIVVDGKPVPSRGLAAIANGRDVVVYPAPGPAHDLDLFVVRRASGAWSTPTNLTAGSSAPFNQRPAISDDGARIAFACGPSAGASAPGTSLCEVGVDGAGLRVVASPKSAGASSADAYVGSADFAPDGELVAEASLADVTQLWTVAPTGQASVVAAGVVSDASPCVFSDGRVASVWAGRDPNSGLHELKVANANGGDAAVLTPGVPAPDVGIGCSR